MNVLCDAACVLRAVRIIAFTWEELDVVYAPML